MRANPRRLMPQGALERRFTRNVPMPNIRLVIASDQLAVRQALAQLLSAPLLGQHTDDLRGRAEIVLAEVLNNIVDHAYADCAGEITLELSEEPAGIACRICDNGSAMPGLVLPEGQLAAHDPDALPEGGFGWFLIRTLTQDLCYARQGRINELRFRLPETETS